MEKLEQALGAASGFIWGWPLIILLMGAHVFLTFRLGFIQRLIPLGIRLSLIRKKEGKGDVSQFGALTTALAATIGTGNIIGVSTAVVAGGPGAVLWMWLTGVFGIATKYAEAVLSVKYRVQTKTGMAGGPMYVIEKALGWKWLAVLFAVFTAISAFGIGNMVQAGAIASQLKSGMNIPGWATGLFLSGLTALVILGGIKSIARFCEWLVPFMAIFYVLGCLIILGFNFPVIPETISLILSSAFTGHAAVGGFVGAGIKEAIRFGVARGLFSNESGLGSAPIVAAAAQTKDPVRQGLVSSTGTFWDTVVVCAMTGLVIVGSGEWKVGGTGAEVVKRAFDQLPYIGPTILTLGLFTFVFSTILGWAYYGEKAVEYLFGSKSIFSYRLLWVAAVFVGTTVSMKALWDFSDITNAFMAVPNLIALFLLSGVVAAETKKHLKNARLDIYGRQDKRKKKK